VSEKRFDPDFLDEEDPFEVDAHAAHLFKHPYLGIDDVDEVWPVIRCSIRRSRLRTG
jgi:hypothetical protein